MQRWGRLLLTHSIVLVVLLLADDWLYAHFQVAIAWLREHGFRSLLLPVNHFYRALGNFWVVVWVAIFLWRFDPQHRARLRALVAGAVLAGVLQGGISVAVGRIRPGEPREEFGKFLPFYVSRTEDVPRSFPSGHTTVAFAAATYIALAYPQARRMVYLLACVCGLSRVANADHYFGDVYGGALLGHYVTYACWVYAHRPGWQSARWYLALAGRRQVSTTASRLDRAGSAPPAFQAQAVAHAVKQSAGAQNRTVNCA